MGQAKRRGSFEERKRQSIEKYEQEKKARIERDRAIAAAKTEEDRAYERKRKLKAQQLLATMYGMFMYHPPGHYAVLGHSKKFKLNRDEDG